MPCNPQNGEKNLKQPVVLKVPISKVFVPKLSACSAPGSGSEIQRKFQIHWESD